MTITPVFSHHYLREQRLRFIRTHLEAFDVEPRFPLPLFEEAVLEIEGYCGIEPTCHVQGDRIFAGDIQVATYEKTWPKSLMGASKFLDKVGSQVGVQINRNLLDRFSSLYIHSSKIETNTIGIDLRPTIQDSLIKIYMHLHPGGSHEDLVMTALALDGANYSAEVTEVLLKDGALIGFNLFLDGRSNIEIWAISPGGKYQHKGNFGRDLAAYIRKNFSQKVNFLFDVADGIAASFSKQKIDPIFYFHFFDIKDIPKYFAFNSLGDRIYDFYQSQDCVTYASISVREQDLESSRLDNYGFLGSSLLGMVR
ncbi:MAG: LynF/TruF/PatF family peptide O-prenyltransferase [Microcystis aeruginosa SX13-01]|nr:LynF/TruF/PatF family peptide O-prenyltransferase [Microcystis aeruginosa SX13-01]